MQALLRITALSVVCMALSGLPFGVLKAGVPLKVSRRVPSRA